MLDVLASSGTVVNSQVTAAIHNTLLDVLGLLLNVLVAGGIWAMKTWLASMKSDWKRALAERLVKYAEQKIGDNEEKRQWVASQISAKFPRISQDEVNHLLEEAVVNLRAQTSAPVVAAVTVTAPVVVEEKPA
jgi:hypothetical protein